MSLFYDILPEVLGAFLKAFFDILFSSETVWTVSDLPGIDGLDVKGGPKPRLTPDDLPAF